MRRRVPRVHPLAPGSILFNVPILAPPRMSEADPDPAETPTSADPEPGPTQAQIDAALREAAEWREKAARARADYDNLQKRTTRDADTERDRNKARALEGFLPLLELCHMAAHQAETHPGPLSEGIAMLAREFDRLAQREGLVRVGAIGEKLDRSRHEVVATEAADGVAPGCVSRIVQPGYLLGERVLRFAKVCVAPG